MSTKSGDEFIKMKKEKHGTCGARMGRFECTWWLGHDGNHYDEVGACVFLPKGHPEADPSTTDEKGGVMSDHIKIEVLESGFIQMDATIAGRDVRLLSSDEGVTWHEGRVVGEFWYLNAYKPNEEESLRDVLRALGLHYTVDADHSIILVSENDSPCIGKACWPNGSCSICAPMFKGSAPDVWAWLRNSGRIT